MSCGPSQADRILAALRSGPFAATDFAAPNIRDGLAPIFRVAARIGELRDQGYEITTGRLTNGVAVYTLTSDVGVGDDGRTSAGRRSLTEPTVIPGAFTPRPDAAAGISLSAGGGSLFNTDEYAQRLSVYDRQVA
jgi:hypothetical protein